MFFQRRSYVDFEAKQRERRAKDKSYKPNFHSKIMSFDDFDEKEFVFKNKPRNTRDVGRQLNADLVLEASVLREGTKLRINAQLVRAADDVPIWSERYDRELKDVFAIQDEISRSIVNELRLKLGRGQRRYAIGYGGSCDRGSSRR